MNWLARGLTSSVGLKFLMGVSGILLVLFVIGHMLGNLQVFLGAEVLNAYAGHLRDLGVFLWLVRFGLLAAFVLHLVTGVALWWKNRRARAVPYARWQPLESTFSSRTMIWTGILVLVFLVYHLLHFTFRVTNPGHVEMVDGHVDVYQMVILGFRDPAIALPYVAAMILLFFHLYHGIASIFQSLGWNHPKYRPFYEGLGRTLAVILVIGNVAMPLLVLVGLVGEGVK